MARGAQARELAILLEIRAMPTFKVFKGKQEVGAQQGWSEAEARAVPSPRRRALGQYALAPRLWPLVSCSAPDDSLGRLLPLMAGAQAARGEWRQEGGAARTKGGVRGVWCARESDRFHLVPVYRIANECGRVHRVLACWDGAWLGVRKYAPS